MLGVGCYGLWCFGCSMKHVFLGKPFVVFIFCDFVFVCVGVRVILLL